MKYRDINIRILKILIPAILQNALLCISNMILTAYIGRLAVAEISSYGLANNIYNIYFDLFYGFAIGTMVIFAVAFGRKDYKLAARLQKTAVCTIIPMALICTSVVVLFSKYFLSLMTSDANLIEIASRYIRYSIFSYPLISLVHINNAAFQANSDTKTPLFIAMTGNCFTIVVGYFVIGMFKLPGAAFVQTLSNGMMFLTGTYFLYRKNGLLPRNIGRLTGKDFKQISSLLRVGIPSAIENSFWSFAMVFVGAMILSYGQNVYAAFQLGLQGETFCNMMSAGFLTASLSLSGNAIGSLDGDLFKLYYRQLSRICGVISIITMGYLAFFSEWTMTLLTDKPELIAIGTQYLMAMIFSQYPAHKQKVLFGYLRSAGQIKETLVINAIGIWLVRVLFIVILGYMHANIIFIWWAFNADQWVRDLLAQLLFMKKNIINYVNEMNNKKRVEEMMTQSYKKEMECQI